MKKSAKKSVSAKRVSRVSRTRSTSTSSNNVVLLIIGLIVVVVGVAAALFMMKPKTEKVVDRTAQTTPELSNDPNTITLWAWNIAAKSLKELVPAFNQKYPDIKVNVVEFPYEEANRKFASAISTGTGFPDIWDTEGPVTAQYIKAGALLDITDRVAARRGEFVDYKWAEVTQNGRIYAVPWDAAPVAFFYRRDLFAEAGVNPDTIRTWDDFIEAGKKVTKDLNGDGRPDQYMFFLSLKSDVQDTFEVLLQQDGGSIFDAQGKVVFNNEKGVRAVQLMKKISDSGIADPNVGWWTPEMFSSIKAGRVASLFQGVWMGGQIKEIAPDQSGKWGVFPLPAIQAGGLRSAVNGGSNLAITTKSTKQEAAWKFIEFALMTKESQMQMYKNYNIFPALESTYTDPAFNEPNAFFGGQNTSSVFIETQRRLPANWYYGSSYNQTTSIISAEIVKALNNEKTPKQALDDAAAQVNAALGIK